MVHHRRARGTRTGDDVDDAIGELGLLQQLGERTTFGSLPPSPAWKNTRSCGVAGAGRAQYFTYQANTETGFRYDLVRRAVQ